MPDCIFCQIIENKSPADIVYQSDKVIAFRNINPAAPVHILIVPKRHVPTVVKLEDQDKDAIAEMLLAVREIAAQEGVDESGFKLVVNKGGPDVEMIIDHFHIHLIGGKKLEGELV